jgi:hypothetical protein
MPDDLILMITSSGPGSGSGNSRIGAVITKEHNGFHLGYWPLAVLSVHRPSETPF